MTYPRATDLIQPGRKEPLAVFGPEFTIDVELSVAKTVAPGALRIPVK